MTTRLDDLPLGLPSLVRCLDADPHQTRLLADIGFLPGEPVQVLHRALPGGDPLVVRIGDSRFALRRAEARCVLVEAGS